MAIWKGYGPKSILHDHLVGCLKAAPVRRRRPRIDAAGARPAGQGGPLAKRPPGAIGKRERYRIGLPVVSHLVHSAPRFRREYGLVGQNQVAISPSFAGRVGGRLRSADGRPSPGARMESFGIKPAG